MALNLKTPSSPTPKPEPKKDKKEPVAPSGGGVMEVLAAIRKSKGEKVVVNGNQLHVPRRLPTGIFEFDFYIGGGFPRGRYSIVYGPESGCKTNIALKAAAVAQQSLDKTEDGTRRNKVVWVNLEQSFDPIWAAKMGVNITDLLVVEAGYGEEAVDLVDALVRADDVALVVVDSMAALIANKEIGQSTETYDIGTSALLIKRMVNKLMIAFSEQKKKGLDPCVILLNQTRFKPGVMFGDPETMPGGEAQKFLSSLRVRFNAKNIIEKASNTVVFKEVHAVVKKSKVPVRAASFDFKMCVAPNEEGLPIGDTDSFNMVKGHLQSLGLLTKQGQGYKLSMSLTTGLMFPTLTAIQDKYNEDPAFRAGMQQLVIESYKDQMIFVDEDVKGPKEVPPGKVQPIAGE